jgi:hypothetical protein
MAHNPEPPTLVAVARQEEAEILSLVERWMA